MITRYVFAAKTNPLSDIGVDFAAINRKEKRLEPKSSAPPATSTIVMGKAMGSGSGVGRSAASSFTAAPPNSMMTSGMGAMGGGGGMGMGGGPGMGIGNGVGIGMGGYGGYMQNQQSMDMNMGMNNGVNPRMGMNMGMSQPQGPGMPGSSYNPLMGMGVYSSRNQQPYGGGYR